MDRQSKQWITVIMWVALAAFLVITVLNAAAIPEAWMLLPLTMVPLTFGVFVTLALWSPAVFPWIDAERLRAIQSGANSPEETQREKHKRKRDSTSQPSEVEVLLSLMDDHEKEELKRELKRRILNSATVGEDGEIEYHGLALSDLLDDDALSKSG